MNEHSSWTARTGHSGRLSHNWRMIAAVVALMVAVSATTAWAVRRSSSAVAATATPTRTVTVGVGTVQQSVVASGTIEPTTTANLNFSAAGQVTAVHVIQGQKVQAGQQLATISSASLASQVAQSNASVAAALAKLSTDQTAAASAAQIAADQASVTVARAQLADAQAALTGATLTSPIAGTVTAVNLMVGQQLSASGASSGASSGANSGASSGSVAGSGSGTGSGSGSSSGASSGLGSGQSGSTSGSASSGSGGSSGSSSSTSSTGQIQVISTGSYVVDASVGASDLANIAKGDQVTITTTGSTTPVFGLVSSIGIVASSSSGSAGFPVVISVTGSPSPKLRAV